MSKKFWKVNRQNNSINKTGDGGWHTGVKRVNSCDFCKESKPVIYLSWVVDDKIWGITQKMSTMPRDTEWLGYLDGEEKGQDVYYIKDISIPKQKVSMAHVDVLETSGAFGTIHLHPGSGKPGHSGTDDRYIAGNHTVMIVTSHSGEYEGHIKKVLPCGSSILIPAEVQIWHTPPADLTEFIEEAFKNIDQEALVIQELSPTVDANKPAYQGTMYCGKCHGYITPGFGQWQEGIQYHHDCLPKNQPEATTSRYCFTCNQSKTVPYAAGIWANGYWKCPDCIKSGKQSPTVPVDVP